MSEHQFRYQPGQRIGTRYHVHQTLRGSISEVYFCRILTKKQGKGTERPFPNPRRSSIMARLGDDEPVL